MQITNLENLTAKLAQSPPTGPPQNTTTHGHFRSEVHSQPIFVLRELNESMKTYTSGKRRYTFGNSTERSTCRIKYSLKLSYKETVEGRIQELERYRKIEITK